MYDTLQGVENERNVISGSASHGAYSLVHQIVWRQLNGWLMLSTEWMINVKSVSGSQGQKIAL